MIDSKNITANDSNQGTKGPPPKRILNATPFRSDNGYRDAILSSIGFFPHAEFAESTRHVQRMASDESYSVLSGDD